MKLPWIKTAKADPIVPRDYSKPDVVNNFIDSALLDRFADRIVPLGSFCVVSSIMKRFGIKRTSLPFDWLFAGPEVVLRCLDDDFAQYLNNEHYRSYTATLGRRCCAHLLYDPDPLGMQLFNHRDPTDAEDYRYLSRCVERFRAIMATRDDKLLC